MPQSSVITKPEVPVAIFQESSVPEAKTSFRWLITKCLSALLFCLLGLFVAEATSRLLIAAAKPAASYSLELDRKYQLAQVPLGKAPLILIMGDSLADFGLFSEYLATLLRERGIQSQVLNLGVPGNTIAINRALLEKAILTGNKPSVLLYVVHPRVFNKNYQAKINEDLLGKTYLGRCELGMAQPKPWSCFFEKHLFLVRYRSFLNERLRALPDILLKPESAFWLERQDYVRVETSPFGWAPGYQSYTQPEFHKKFSQALYFNKAKGDLGQYVWEAGPFLEFQRFCHKQGIQLVLLWLPEHPITNAYYVRYHLSPQALAKHFTTLGQQQGFPFINLHHAITHSIAYHDPDHLNAVGAVEATRLLADTLLQIPGFKQWLSLPTPQGGAQ
ncbi:MAG TPA: hypothetical protein V6C99_08160 [Oculatellaceae cyanobacterium]|jgi:hypothetical protein